MMYILITALIILKILEIKPIAELSWVVVIGISVLILIPFSVFIIITLLVSILLAVVYWRFIKR